MKAHPDNGVGFFYGPPLDAESEALRRLGYHLTMHVKKPLLGFGWMGWVLLAIAGALLLLALQENPDLIALHFLGLLFGNGIENWVSARLLSAHRLNAILPIGPSPLFGLWGLMAFLLAIQISLSKVRWWWVAFIIGLAILSPLFGLRNFPLWLSNGGTSLSLNQEQSFVISYSCAHLLFAVGTYGTTKSKIALCGVVIISIASTVSVYAIVTRMPFLLYFGTSSNGRLWFVIAGWAWNPLLLAILLSWAIPARIKFNRSWWQCTKCQYDMRDLETNTCPECGVINSRMPAPAPTSSP